MAARFWVGGTASWNSSNTTSWSDTSGGAGGASVPTSADSVTFDMLSNATAYTVTVTATANCLDLTIGNPLAGAVSWNGASALNIAGNLSVASGITRNYTGTITFTATSGTKTITTNSVSLGSSITFNGTGGTFQLIDALTTSGADFTRTAGTFAANSQLVSLTGVTVNLVGDFTGANTFASLTRTGTAVKTCSLELFNNIACTGTFTCTGNSAINRMLLFATVIGTALTISAGTFAINATDLRDITKAGAGSGDLSGASLFSGDALGNSGWTFTTAATQTWATTSGGLWSTNAWTSRVPLPQDDVTINAAFAAGQTITADMPRLGKSITFANTGNSVAWAKTAATITMYGGLTMTSTSLMTNSGLTDFRFQGRGVHTLTSAGQTFTNPITITMVGGTLTQQDAFACSSSCDLGPGTYSLNEFNATFTTFTSTTSMARTLTLGSGTLTLTGTLFSIGPTGMTLTATTGTIALTDVSASAKTFAGGGKAYGVISITTGGTGTVTLTGAGTFTRLVCPGGSTKSIILPGSTTTTFTGTTPFPSGAAGNLLTFTSSSGVATVAFTSQAVCDYISLTNVAASTGPQIAGANSTLSGTTTNWVTTIGQPTAVRFSGVPGANRRQQLSGRGW